MSRDALQQRLTLHAAAAGQSCPSLASKNVTPHVLRHSAAMALLHAGVDITVIALWLGHESVTTTQIYLQADMALKQQALDRTTPPASRPGPLPAPRPAPRVPRSPVIMPISRTRSPPPASTGRPVSA